MEIEMSLDDIIKSRKTASNGGSRKAPAASLRTSASIPLKTKRLGTQTTSPKVLRSPATIPDARNRIIERNRSHITDARDKLVQITKQSGDVRQKLLRKQQKQLQHSGGVAGGRVKSLTSASSAAAAAGKMLAARRGGQHHSLAVVAGPNAPRRRGAHSPHIADDDMDDMDVDFAPASYALRRTVHNDIAYTKMPPLPQFSRVSPGAPPPASIYQPQPHHYRSLPSHDQQHHYDSEHHHSHHHQQQHPLHVQHRNVRPSPPRMVATNNWSPAGGPSHPDPFDCYEVPLQRPVDVSEPRFMQRQIRQTNAPVVGGGGVGGHHPGLLPTKGILRYVGGRDISPSAATFSNPYSINNLQHQQSHHYRADPRTPSPRSPPPSAVRQQVKPIRQTTSTGASSENAPRGSSASASSASSSSLGGYRIVVSNLHSSVSHSDIRELFEDIGELLEARLVRPGVAEVIFRAMKDAELAVETYHNRQLDGQPMKCLLVNPRPVASRPTAPALKSGERGGAQRSSTVSKATTSSSSSAAKSGNGKTPLEIDIDALHKVLFQPKSYSRR